MILPFATATSSVPASCWETCFIFWDGLRSGLPAQQLLSRKGPYRRLICARKRLSLHKLHSYEDSHRSTCLNLASIDRLGDRCLDHITQRWIEVHMSRQFVLVPHSCPSSRTVCLRAFSSVTPRLSSTPAAMPLPSRTSPNSRCSVPM